MFRALLLQKDDATGFRAALTDLPDEALDEHAADADVTVRVECSTLNFKDALALTNRSPVVRRWPMVPGIDCAGIVQDSRHPDFGVGDRVVLNGWGVGESHWGGLAQRARLKGDWLLRLPESLDSARAMAIGTAGYTAMLCALALRREGVTPEQGDVLVTGAAGGVGSVAIAILAAWGYRVVGSTGRTSEEAYLKSLGAAAVIDRSELSQPGKPLQRERWAGVVDAVGSHTLANACAQTKYRGTVTACGLAQGMDFPATVAPFILRGVKLIGVDSVMCPMSERRLAWDELARSLDPARLDEMTTRIGLSEATDWAPRILGGQVRGRLVVDVDR